MNGQAKATWILDIVGHGRTAAVAHAGEAITEALRFAARMGVDVDVCRVSIDGVITMWGVGDLEGETLLRAARGEQ